MDLRFWLVLVGAFSLNARRVRPRDDEVLEALSELILESQEARGARQTDSEVFDGAFPSFGFDDFQPGENCELVGFEFLNKTECNEVSEIECALANVTKFRTELVDKCTTVIDKTCDLRMKEVPERKCSERIKKK